MHKGLTLAVWVLAAPLVAQQQTLTCRSTGGQQFCPANTTNGVRLVRERSDGLCQQGSTWSYDRRGITVSGGCSAEFEVSGTSNNSGNGYGNGYGNGDNGQSAGQGYGNGGYNNGNNRGRGVVIPAGTQLTVRIEQNVRPTEIGADEVISGTLTNDVSVSGSVVATSGTPVQARLDSAQGSTFNLRLTSMTLNGRTYMLSTNSVHSLRDAANADTSNQSAKKQFGSILGNIATGGQINSGTVFNFRLTAPAQASGRGNNGGGNNNNQ